MELHTIGKVVVDKVDSLVVNIFFGRHPSHPSLNYDDDSDVAVTWRSVSKVTWDC